MIKDYCEKMGYFIVDEKYLEKIEAEVTNVRWDNDSRLDPTLHIGIKNDSVNELQLPQCIPVRKGDYVRAYFDLKETTGTTRRHTQKRQLRTTEEPYKLEILKYPL